MPVGTIKNLVHERLCLGAETVSLTATGFKPAECGARVFQVVMIVHFVDIKL